MTFSFRKIGCFMICLILVGEHIQSQTNTSTTELESLDKSFFKWQKFSFRRSFDSLKSICDLYPIHIYDDNYLNYYAGEISDTGKSYYLENESYHQFNKINFDKVILHLKGSSKNSFNVSSLCFVKHLNDSNVANKFYTEALAFLKNKYGKSFTEELKKYDSETVKKMQPNTVYEYLPENHPFNEIERTKWEGNKAIYLVLEYSKQDKTIILQASEYISTSFYTSKNLFAESEYAEKFTRAFKDFDNNNGYKQLKFGMTKSDIGRIVKLSAPDLLKQYTVQSDQYKVWFNMIFDECYLTLNKKGQLSDVINFKINFSALEYQEFLDELVKLLGRPSMFKEKGTKSEFTVWKGKNIHLIIMRGDDDTINVDFNSVKFDDSSESDLLY